MYRKFDIFTETFEYFNGAKVIILKKPPRKIIRFWRHPFALVWFVVDTGRKWPSNVKYALTTHYFINKPKKIDLCCFDETIITLDYKNFHFSVTFKILDFYEKFLLEKKNHDLYFLTLQIKNKLTPDIYVTKNFLKLTTIFEKKNEFLKIKSNWYQTMISEIFKKSGINFFFYINKRFIFYFLEKFLNKYKIETNFNTYIKLYKPKKYIRFIKKFPRLKKKYRNVINKKILLKI